MASLIEIKKKIVGVKNTRKITKAMQLVAASKMQYFQKRAIAMRGFIDELLLSLNQNLQNQADSKYTKTPPSKKTLFVIYTSDKGLCGALNYKLINNFLNSPKFKNTEHENKLLITIGKKSYEFAQKHNLNVLKHLSGFSEKLSTLEAIKLTSEILEPFEKKEVKEIIFFSPHFKNSFTYYPVSKQYLPLNQAMFEQKSQDKSDRLLEPSNELLTEKLHQMIIQSLFIQSFIELKAAEYSSRMIAMKNATESADKIIKNLTLTFNKARQQNITQEIAELVGASAAMSE